MKATQVCPKCQGRKFFQIESASITDHGSSNCTKQLSLAAAWMPTGESGIFGDKHDRLYASVEAWVCASCGYTELYTPDLEVLASMAEHGKADVRIVDAGHEDRGAYR